MHCVSTQYGRCDVVGQQVGQGGKVRVLGKKGGYLKVRDQQGNEGWVDEKAF